MSNATYQLVKVIGSGCFGYVFEAQNKKTKERVALKRIQKVGNQVSRQFQILYAIKDCQNVVKMKEFFYSRNYQNKLIQNIVFEFVDDNLQNLIDRQLRANTLLKENLVKEYMYQLLNGLKQIHSKNISHRDLKPENVLLSKKGIIKICDFGSSKIIDKNGKNTPYIVSRYYRAPQLIMCITKYGVEIDIWAAGCILAELLILSPIFKGKTEGDQLFAIFEILGSFTEKEKEELKKRVPFDESLFEKFPQYPKGGLKDIFEDVKDRENAIDLIEKMLTYIPEDRITAEQALKHSFFDQVRPNMQSKIYNQEQETEEENN